MKTKLTRETSLGQWLVMLSIPLTVMALGGLFRMLFDHQTRLAAIESRCVHQTTLSSRSEPTKSTVILASPEPGFIREAYRFAAFLWKRTDHEARP